MFVPPAVSLLNALGVDRSTFERGGLVEIPVSLLKLLLQIALAAADFDEEGYLRANPDVAKAIARGEVESAKLHHIVYGYFEGRQGAGPEVDEEWYLQAYPDVATAVQEKKISSATDHFQVVGAGEGRSPSGDLQDDALHWKQALKAS
jgi:hypothetical protein